VPRAIWLVLVTGVSVACDTRRPGPEESSSAPGTALSAAPTECLTDFRADVDYFPHKTELHAAQGFAVTYHRFYKVLSTRSRWQGAPWADTVVLLQCGAPRDLLPERLRQLPTVLIPVKSAGFNDEGDYARMSSLPRLPELRLIVGPRVREGAADVIFISTRNIDPGLAMRQARAGQLAAVATQNWVEGPSPLGRTEWIKHHALFTNGEAEAAIHFDSIASNYAVLAREVGRQFKFTRVFWGGRDNNRVWRTHNTNLESRLLADAGGLNIFLQESAARFLSLSETGVLRRAPNIDVWINDGVPTTQMPQELLQQIAAVQNKRVYRYAIDQRSGVPLWFTAASVRPTLVLAELIALFHEPVRSSYKYFVPDLP
jgi:iron complex transport system substrate-binding protein